MLAALQATASLPELPLGDCLLQSANTDRPPAYLVSAKTGSARARGYAMGPIFSEGRGVRLPDVCGHWPSEGSTLDRWQLQAAKCLLTRRLGLVQGPPGTGKTYVGLLVVRAPRWVAERETNRPVVPNLSPKPTSTHLLPVCVCAGTFLKNAVLWGASGGADGGDGDQEEEEEEEEEEEVAVGGGDGKAAKRKYPSSKQEARGRPSPAGSPGGSSPAVVPKAPGKLGKIIRRPSATSLLPGDYN